MALSFVDAETILYDPPAFDDPSNEVLRSVVPHAIAVSDEDANQYFACNNLVIGRCVLLDNCTPALRADLARQVQPAYEKAIDGDTLPPLISLLPKMLDLGYVEYTADGAAPKTREDLMQMGARAREMINSELRRINMRTVAIDNVSHSTWDGNTRGVHSAERDELRGNVTYLKQIDKTARDARRFAMELGFDGKVWEPIIADASDLAERSQAILDFIP